MFTNSTTKWGPSVQIHESVQGCLTVQSPARAHSLLRKKNKHRVEAEGGRGANEESHHWGRRILFQQLLMLTVLHIVAGQFGVSRMGITHFPRVVMSQCCKTCKSVFIRYEIDPKCHYQSFMKC